MIDDGKVCMHCAFFDGFDSVCKAHPPAFAGYSRDEDGEQVREFVQPVIDRDWSESCGEWQASDPGKSLEERRLEIHRAAFEDVSPVEARNENCWIPTSERLPEQDAWCVIAIRVPGRYSGKRPASPGIEADLGKWQGNQWKTLSGPGKTTLHPSMVTHWMPLPEPPELK